MKPTKKNMKWRFLFLVLLLFVISVYQSPAQITATGKGYQDNNKNGKLNSEEKGIPEVPGSNGHEVVLTNDKGEYSLEIDEKDARIFVINPSEYQLPIDEQNHPKFYYLHKPDGSPELDYSGVEPTGSLPESIYFPLLE